MKGIVFTVFNKLIEEKFGLEMWDSLLDAVAPPSGGVYTSGATYPDQELLSLVGELSAKTGVPVPDLVRVFGEYTFHELVRLYPVFVKDKTVKQFLLSIHDVVHVEVKKLYPEAGLPDFLYEDPGPNDLVMKYKSPRRLCPLAEGLIDGAAKHFGAKIENRHTKCMHKGDDHCRFELHFA